jgi:hypothetical protein
MKEDEEETKPGVRYWSVVKASNSAIENNRMHMLNQLALKGANADVYSFHERASISFYAAIHVSFSGDDGNLVNVKIKSGQFFEASLEAKTGNNRSAIEPLGEVFRLVTCIRFTLGSTTVGWIVVDTYDAIELDTKHLELKLRRNSDYLKIRSCNWAGWTPLRQLDCYVWNNVFYINTHLNGDIRSRIDF